MHKQLWMLAVATMIIFAGHAAVAQCCGDCNGDGQVTVDELVVTATRALGACRNDGVCAPVAAQLAQCNSSLITCNTSLGTCNGSLGTCNSNLTDAQTSLATCNSNYSTCSGNLTACNGSLTNSQNMLATCNSNYSTCTGSLSTCNTSLTNAQGSLHTCNSNYATCNGNLNTCNANLTNVQASLTTCNSNYSTCSGDLANCSASLSTCGAGTATSTNVLSGKTFSSSAGLGLTGTMPNNGAVMITPGTVPQAIPAGYHNGTGKVLGDPDLVAGNIKSGVTIFGVVGTLACGNGVVEAGEQCDQGNLTGQTCITQGFAGGTLACGPNCIFDTSGCYTARFVDNGDGTITDHSTGLIWEKKAWDGSIHDWNKLYPWAGAFSAFIAGLNTPPCFAGHCDWQMPDLNELQNIVDYQAANPAVNGVFNANCNPGCTVSGCSCTQSSYYWSATSYISFPSYAWDVNFGNGGLLNFAKANSSYVRAVRSGKGAVVLPVCGNGVAEPPEDCDIGGICIGNAKAGTACHTDTESTCCSNTGCTGPNDGGICLAGDKGGAQCTSNADCPGSTCIRCKVFEGKTPENQNCAANCTFESLVGFNLVSGQPDPSTLVKAGTSGAVVHGALLSLPLLIGDGCVGGANDGAPCSAGVGTCVSNFCAQAPTGSPHPVACTKDTDCEGNAFCSAGGPGAGVCEPATQTLGVGKVSADGSIPLVIKSNTVRFPRIDVGGLACACVRGVAQQSCGGTAFEADGTTETPFCSPGFGNCDSTHHCSQLPNVSCTVNTDCEGNAVCTAAGRNPCAYVHGMGNSAGGLAGCSASGLQGVNYEFSRDAGGCDDPPACTKRTPKAPVIQFSGMGPQGSALMLNTTAIGTSVGSCFGTDQAIYGADGVICTNDDPQASRGTPATIPLTTGQASAIVFNANFTPADTCNTAAGHCVNNTSFPCTRDTDCSTTICDTGASGTDCKPYETQGAPFSCSALESGGSIGGGLVSAFVSLDQPTIQDTAVVSQFFAQ